MCEANAAISSGGFVAKGEQVISLQQNIRTTSGPLARNYRSHGVTAVLGPTNTGKTHYAIERLVAHPSGIIGLPLRLLAREVYTRVVEKVGEDAVALITGEEKIKPPNPRFWVATVEAMPRDVDVSFLAIDEIQLAHDLERGHVFTDRLLNRRGRDETLLLGADTMRPILERLIPGIRVVTRPRLSVLNYTGARKITRLPRRSAIVAFSSEDVYAIAELIRRQRGGAAVVLGALSPRTRNAQVALYQNGDVDFLVATDAIGMGLNLDLDHVAFAGSRKFDGFQFRHLTLSEMGQVAGRAGRYKRDGTFGVTGRVNELETETIQRLESHVFPPVEVLQWRSTELNFSSLAALSASLSTLPDEPGLTRAPAGEDIRVLETAMREREIRDMASTRHGVRRLWEAAQIPDYRKIAPAHHVDMILTLYRFMMREGVIPDDWIAAQVRTCDRTDGDIDTLGARIAHVRTWTYVANRPDWLENPVAWQETTRALEDRLSDALHERLTQRFVDRRTSVLSRRLKEKTVLDAEIDSNGEVTVEDQHIGRLAGFVFTPAADADASQAKALRTAAERALAGEIARRADTLSQATADKLALGADLSVQWNGNPVGRVVAADAPLKPRVVLVADEQLTGPDREKVQERLDRYVAMTITNTLKPLFDMELDSELTPAVRGLAFRMAENLGIVERAPVADEVKALGQEDRALLRKHGVRFGAFHIFVPALLKPAPRKLAAQLWALNAGGAADVSPSEVETRLVPELVASGRTSILRDPAIPDAVYSLLGFKAVGKHAVRIDILERLGDTVREAMAWRPLSGQPRPEGHVDGGAFRIAPNMTSLLGCSNEEMAEVLAALGFRKDRRPPPVFDDEPNKTAPAPETTVENPTADTPAPSEEEATKTSSEPMDASAEVSSGTTEEQPAQAAETPQEGAEEAPTDGLIDVWRPGRRDGAHRSHAARGRGNRKRNEGGGKKNAGQRQDGGDRKQPARKAQRPAKKVDPDSPFAKLASLKRDLEGGS